MTFVEGFKHKCLITYEFSIPYKMVSFYGFLNVKVPRFLIMEICLLRYILVCQASAEGVSARSE